MTASLKETLISVWKQGLIDDAEAAILETAVLPSGALADLVCAKWIFNLKVTNCVAWNRIPK